MAANFASAAFCSATVTTPSKRQTLPRLQRLGHVNAHDIAGPDRPAEPAVIDRHEVNVSAFGFGTERMDDEHSRRLCHRLDDHDAGHDRHAGKVALKLGFVDRDVLYAGRGNVRDQLDNAVDQEHRVTMRNHLHDPLDVYDILLPSPSFVNHSWNPCAGSGAEQLPLDERTP